MNAQPMAPPPPPLSPTRRSVLKRGLLGGGLLALGGSGWLALRPGAPVALPAEGLKVLSASEYAVVHALAGRFIPDLAGAPSVVDVHVALKVDRILALTEPTVQTEVKQLLGLFENALAGFLFGRHTQPFTRMSGPAQEEVLRAWQTSRLTLRRTGYTALRGLVMAAFYGSPETFAATGYGGPPEGFHQPDAAAWRGVGPRPDGNGVFHPGSK